MIVKGLIVLLCAVSISIVCGDDDVSTEIDENEMGMEVYFDLVKGFLGEVVQRKNISESFLNLSTIVVNGKVDTDSLTDWQSWAKYLVGYLTCVCLGVLFIVVMPITGLIFCCCRLCGRCGGRPKEQDSKHATCKRRSYCTSLLILNTLMLGGAICALVSTNLLQEHLEDEENGAVGHMKSGVQQMETFVNESVVNISKTVEERFESVSTEVLQQVNDSAANAVDMVLESINATALIDEAHKVNEEATAIGNQLNLTADLLGDLTNSTDSLKQNLTDIQSDVESVCNTNPSCPPFEFDDYKVQTDFSSLSRLRDEATKVGESLDMSEYIAQAEQSIEAEKEKAAASIQDVTRQAGDAIKEVNKAINDGLSGLRTTKDSAVSQIERLRQDLDKAEKDYILEYNDYFYYGGVGVSCLFLVIIVLYYLGVLYGLCGERPGEGAPCCNTGTGANFLMGGVGITFLLTWLLMILCVVLFVVGGPAYTEVCRYFDDHEPTKFKIFDDALTNGVDLSDFYERVPPDLSIVETLQQCQNNSPIFEALDLAYIVNLDDILNTTDIDNEINKLTQQDINIGNVTIITQELKDDLMKLADSGIESIPFDDYYSQLNITVTGAPLGNLSQQLETVANGLAEGNDKETLRRSATRLKTLDEEDIPSIEHQMKTLDGTLRQLQKQKGLKDSINNLITSMEVAENNFNTNKDDLVKEEIEKLASTIKDLINNAAEGIKNEVMHDMLQCRPLSDALYTISDSVCILIVRPLNGFWFSLGWCLFLCIPCLIFGVLLASQYRREHEYLKDFEEPNYLMYGGPNPDTIPLTSRVEW